MLPATHDNVEVTMQVLMSVLALFMLATAAHAQSAEAPVYSVGDTWKRSNGTEVTVVKVDDNSYVFRGGRLDCPTCLTQVDKRLTLLGVMDADGKPVDVTQLQGVFIGPTWRFYEWPLEVKKNWTVSGTRTWKGTPQNLTADITVKSYEDVKTKAGVFKAYKMEYRWTGRNAGVDRSFAWTNTFWYAPDVKQVVKAISTSSGFQEWELESYSLK